MPDILLQVFTQADTITDTVEEVVEVKNLVVYNDDVNTFDWVIDALIEICGHTEEQAEQLTLIIHYRGRATVKEGSYETLLPMKTGLTDRGISAAIE
ncbi:MAG TPA: ATP-dependent Clp protease adaptor ClpS [Chitinophagales bacterium]|nr:ATP-dependent Clp protease adaptor ClpS [Chitinophagales bacterium]